MKALSLALERWKRWKGVKGVKINPFHHFHSLFLFHPSCLRPQQKSPIARAFLCLFCLPPLAIDSIETLLSQADDWRLTWERCPDSSALLWSLVSPRDQPKSPCRFAARSQRMHEEHWGVEGFAYGERPHIVRTSHCRAEREGTTCPQSRAYTQE